jgi:hypothetical protein
VNRRSWIAWAIVTAVLMLVVSILPQSIIFALVAVAVIVTVSRVPSRG